MSYQPHVEGQWYQDASGRSYHWMNGRAVYASAHTGSSSGEVYGSVASGYYTSAQPTQPASWPPTVGPSDYTRHHTSGMHQTTHMRTGNSQSSAPATYPSQNPNVDLYRRSMDPLHNPTGVPQTSEFQQDNDVYKDLDAAAYAAEEQYKAILARFPKYSKNQRKAMPGQIAGDPPGTKADHDNAAYYAKLAYDKFQAAVDARGAMGQNFVGYDSQRGARGHDMRVQVLTSKRDRLGASYNRHNTTSQSLS